jgi:hypothetical protein
MSSSTKAAAAVDYKLSFTPSNTTTGTGGLMIDFCSESPIIGSSTCTAPSGLNVGSATASVGTITPTTSHIKLVTTLTAATPFTVTFSGVHNPTAAGTFYARITTYNDTTAFATYTGVGVVGTTLDQGGIAMSATDDIGVQAVVMETMTFCTDSASPAANCAGASAASLELGSGTPKALGTTTSTAQAFAELSTNAVSGAVVNMKNSNDCGGLRRVTAGATVCDITPTNTANALSGGDGKFGLNVGASAIVTSSGGSGTLTAATNYATSSQYGMTYTGTSTGVSSAYGDPIFNTGGAPVNNVYVPLTFAANASNLTPAGNYSANMNLIASGTF